MALKANGFPSFPGFPDFQANVTFVPIQFFTVVVPYCSRGTVRIVGYALRKVLGWVDEHGNPTREQLRFTYRELIEDAGVSRKSITKALREAVERHCLRCLQPPRPDRSGQPAQSGVYELCWDHEGRYTDRPDDFRGFFYPEAAVVEVQEVSDIVRRPKAARKNIPNAFFDYLLPQERLSVIRVVAALLFYSIQWGPGGERKVPVNKSISELSRLAKLSRHHVHSAVLEARKRGYIEQVDPGCFDPAAGKESRAATYGIRWNRTAEAGGTARSQAKHLDAQPVKKGEREVERSKMVDGAPVRKGERNRSEMVNGDRSKMVNGISIKTELKTDNSTAVPPDGKEDRSGMREEAVADSRFQLLRKAGFDERVARRLAQRHSEEVIERQINWLPNRNVTRSRLGLLRRAIEEDWPKPDTTDLADNDSSLARGFASHYYAAYHGFEGEARTEPFPKDVEIAAKFIPRLLAQERDEALIPEWGRRFGRLIREKHQGDAKAKPNLSFALVLYGDKFLRMLQQEGATRKRKALGSAREAHQRAFTPAFVAYLRLAETELQEANPTVYEAFAKHRQKLRHLMTSGPFPRLG